LERSYFGALVAGDAFRVDFPRNTARVLLQEGMRERLRAASLFFVL